MSDPQTRKARGDLVGRVLTGALAVQVAIAAVLVLGDVRMSGLAWPGSGPTAPRLTEPVAPGDQRRLFRPDRDRPAQETGDVPRRLALSRVSDATYRLDGAIAAGDADRIIARIQEAQPRPEWIVLQSPGGSVRDALTLGRHLREAGISTRVLAGEYCYSACPYLLAGGVERAVGEDAQIGVHQHYFGKSTILPAAFAVEDIQIGQGEVMIYLDEMGLDPFVMHHALTTPPDEIYVLVPDELRTYRFVTKAD